MHQMKKGIIMIGLLATINGMAQTEVNDFTPGINADGVTYFLPKTSIEIVVEAEKEIYTPGEFCDYANKYLRLTDISNTSYGIWTLKGLTVKTIGTRDPEKGFTVKLKDKSIAPLVELSEDGVLLAINQRLPKEEISEASTPVVKQVNPKDFLSEEILSATSTAKMAELVAKEIYSIRESRNAILRGQADNVPKDGEALKIILKNLEEQENALTSMFKGNTSREKKEYTILITPGEAETDEGILFRFSSKRGILPADDLSGSPIYYHFENQTQLPTPDEKKAQKAKRPQGIVHSVPGKALLKITNSQDTFYEEILPIAQYGYTEVLVADLFNKGTTTKVTFDPSTGAIRKIDRE